MYREGLYSVRVRICIFNVFYFSGSSWRLIHKGTTPFGPTLWLSVYVNKAPPVLPPPPLASVPPPESLTNEDLLKHIDFIPSDYAHEETIPLLESTPTSPCQKTRTPSVSLHLPPSR